MCPLILGYFFPWKNMLYNILINQLFRIEERKKSQKSSFNVWCEYIKALLLHPLSRTRAASVGHSDSEPADSGVLLN